MVTSSLWIVKINRSIKLCMMCFIGSSPVSGVSMSIFCLLAFSNRIHNPWDFMVLTISSWLYRFLTEVLLIPLSAFIIRKLEQKETE